MRESRPVRSVLYLILVRFYIIHKWVQRDTQKYRESDNVNFTFDYFQVFV